MVILTKFIGITVALLAIIIFFNQEMLKKIIFYIKQGYRIYWSIGLKVLSGVVFLAASSQCRLSGVIKAMGILYIVGPIVVLLFGRDKLTTYCDWWLRRPPVIFRIWSLLTLTVGGLIIYSA